MPKNNPVVTQESQRISENGLLENYTFVPAFIRQFFVNNIFTRTFAHLIAWSELGAKRLTCTTAGILKVSLVGTGFEHNKTNSGNAPDTYGTAITYTSPVSRIDVFILNNDAVIKLSNDGVTYNDEITIYRDTAYSFDCTVKSINIKNAVALSTARYQIVGWY